MRAIILFSFILSVILSSCNANGEQEAIVVPKNFKGYIMVIFNQKNGTPIKYEGKKRVYEIPQNGILKTQFKPNDGWQEFPEYYYEKIAPENKLLSFAEIKKVPADTIVGFMGAVGSMRKNDYNEDRFMFTQFYIGTKSDIEQAQEQTEKVDFVPSILKQAE
ncbi:MAG: hypothetical protein IPL31_10570 [Saprospiraceae bacterium]|nr:hypothetical protein [Saprospiraceae bacterium]